jgi:hypothetical protein
VGPILALIAPSPLKKKEKKYVYRVNSLNIFKRQSQVMKSTERNFLKNTERTFHCIIMHIFKKQKQKEKQSIIKLYEQSINLT